jgi:hypothetical protein
MKLRSLIVIGLLFSIAALNPGCKKDDLQSAFDAQKDTVKPGAYLPVYPGSYWKYVNENNDTVVKRASAAWQQHSFAYSKDGITYQSGAAYVPYWMGKPVYRYSTLLETRDCDGPTGVFEPVPLLTETAGEKWFYQHRFPCGDQHISQPVYKREVVAKDTSVQVNSVTYSNVIQVMDYWLFGANVQPSNVRYYYYARDIGLVRMDSITSSGPVTKLGLVNYFINQ